jgi:hypothetical protein
MVTIVKYTYTNLTLPENTEIETSNFTMFNPNPEDVEVVAYFTPLVKIYNYKGSYVLNNYTSNFGLFSLGGPNLVKSFNFVAFSSDNENYYIISQGATIRLGIIVYNFSGGSSSYLEVDVYYLDGTTDTFQVSTTSSTVEKTFNLQSKPITKIECKGKLYIYTTNYSTKAYITLSVPSKLITCDESGNQIINEQSFIAPSFESIKIDSTKADYQPSQLLKVVIPKKVSVSLPDLGSVEVQEIYTSEKEVKL